MALMEAVLSVPALPSAVAVGGPAVAIGSLSLLLIKAYADDQRSKSSNLPPVPGEVPGLPVIGNLLQLKEKKPHRTFTKWTETYRPIYSIKTGSNKMAVLNSNEVIKEAMVTKYSSISTRKLSNALKILTADKSIVVMSDYDEFYKAAKKILLTSTLGTNAQIAVNLYGCNMDKNVWENPNEWNPERFLDRQSDQWNCTKQLPLEEEREYVQVLSRLR